jgi:hypothetical protein
VTIFVSYWNLKEALDCTLWTVRFRKGYGPVCRTTRLRDDDDDDDDDDDYDD